MALQLRRGTNQQRLSMTPVAGELIHVTDYLLVQITATDIDGSTETITFSTNHGLSAGDQIQFQSTTQLGLTQFTNYYVISAGLTLTQCRISTSSGGSAVDLTTGTGLTLLFAKTPRLASGAPVGNSVSPLWVGDGTTVGGLSSNALLLDDILDVTITSPQEGHTLYYDATSTQWKNTGILSVDDVNNRVGINDTTPSYALDVTGDVRTTGYLRFGATPSASIVWDNVNNRVYIENATGGSLATNMDAVYINSDANNVDSFLYLKGTAEYLRWNDSSAQFELSDDVSVQGNLEITGNNITTTQTSINLFNATATSINFGGAATSMSIGASGGTVTIPGSLTVNGTTTNINTTNLVVEDKNIILADVTSPTNTTADGGGITLKGATDKEIFWRDSDDRWVFDNGDGTDRVFVYQLDDLSDTVITSANKGQVMYYDGSNFINSSRIQFDNSTYRVRFENNTGATAGTIASSVAFSRNTGLATITDGDGSGAFIGVVNTANTHTVFGSYAAEYYASGNHNLVLRTSSDNFTTNTRLLEVNPVRMTVQNKLYVDVTNSRVGINNTSPNFALDVTGDAYISGDVTVAGNDIKASDNNTNITLTSNTLTAFAGDIKVGGNDIQASDGSTNITMTSNSLTTFAGDIKVGGNDIQASDGNTNITMTSNTLTTFAGDIAVNGGDITTTQTTAGIFDATATTVNAFGAATTLNLGNDANQSSTTNIAVGAINSGTKTINIGTGSLSGSTTNINLGTAWAGTVTIGNNATVGNDLTVTGGDIITSAATATVFNATATTLSVGGAATTLNIANTATASQTVNFATANTASSTYNLMTGSTLNGNTKTINFGTNGASGSTTNIFMGNSNGGTVTINKDLVVSGDLTVNGTTTTIDTTTLLIEDNTIVLNRNEVGAGITAGSAGIEIERGSLTNVSWLYDETYDWWNPAGGANAAARSIFAEGDIIAGTSLATNGDNIYFNNDDGGSGATSSIIVKRGANADVVLRWEETTDRWQTTVDGSTYIDIPTQALDTTSSPQFATVSVTNDLVLTDSIQNSAAQVMVQLSGSGRPTLDLYADTFTVNDNSATANFQVDSSGNATALGYLGTFTNNIQGHDGSNWINWQTTGSDTTTSTTIKTLISVPTATYRAAKVIMSMTRGSDVHIIELLAHHDGTTAYMTSYGEMYTTSLATFTADISTGNMRIRATATSATSTGYKWDQTWIRV